MESIPCPSSSSERWVKLECINESSHSGLRDRRYTSARARFSWSRSNPRNLSHFPSSETKMDACHPRPSVASTTHFFCFWEWYIAWTSRARTGSWRRFNGFFLVHDTGIKCSLNSFFVKRKAKKYITKFLQTRDSFYTKHARNIHERFIIEKKNGEFLKYFCQKLVKKSFFLFENTNFFL